MRPRLADLVPDMLRRRWRRQWLAYVPLAFYLAWLMLRYRSLTLFTAANPGIASGGTTGESKSSILEKLAPLDGRVADFVVIAGHLAPRLRVRLARRWIERERAAFPLVLKPDVGEHGRAVSRIDGPRELARRLLGARETMILQRFVEGRVFGILYRRLPGERCGRILSLAQMSYPPLVGDGQATPGERRVAPHEIGFCSHDAAFADRHDLCTPALERAIDALARTHPGFFVGRFDVCASSAAALRAGRFKVLELNGVSSVPTHIYDPAIGVLQAFRALQRQWHDTFAIAAANHARGAAVTPAAVLIGLLWRRYVEHFDDRARAEHGLLSLVALRTVRQRRRESPPGSGSCPSPARRSRRCRTCRRCCRAG